MRRFVAILFVLLLLLQAIPVLHFFSQNKAAFYSLIDEEKPGEKADIEKKAGKEFLLLSETFVSEQTIPRQYASLSPTFYTSPTLDALTPPPNQQARGNQQTPAA